MAKRLRNKLYKIVHLSIRVENMTEKAAEKTNVRIEKRLLNEARRKFPELKDVSDADVIRIVFRKVLEGKS
jgi:hypothetical protein